MAKLSEQEKRELLDDAHSSERRKEFNSLRKPSEFVSLSPEEYIEFLNQAQQFMKEDAINRPPITGNTFLI